MMGTAHRLGGALAGAGWATYTHQPYPVVAFTAIIATLTAAGPLSPDIDQTVTWHRIPGHGGVLAHRALTHWPAIPLAAWFLLPHVPVPFRLTVTALILGWASHLLADFVCGRVPLTPWGAGKIGLGLRTGGMFELAVATPLMILALAYVTVWLPVRAAFGLAS